MPHAFSLNLRKRKWILEKGCFYAQVGIIPYWKVLSLLSFGST